jgi:hypothetical protein
MVNNDFLPRQVLTRIVGKTANVSFAEYFLVEGINNCLPVMASYECGLSVYVYYTINIMAKMMKLNMIIAVLFTCTIMSFALSQILEKNEI